MKPFKIKRNSWHFWLAKQGGFNEYSSQDICTYLRRMIAGSLNVTLKAALAAFALAAAGLILWSLWEALWWLFAGSGTASNAAQCGLAILVIVAASILFIALVRLRWWWNSRRVQQLKEPGFITLAYRSVKDKTCVKIELE